MHQGTGDQLSVSAPGGGERLSAPARGDAEQPNAPAAPDTCASCGAASTGEYCSVCGEQRSGGDDLKLRRVVGGLIESLTTLDSRAYRSFALLIVRPGFLTAEFAAGRRQRYLAPLHIFVLANLLYFVLPSFGVPVATFGNPLRVQVGALLDQAPEQIAAAERKDWGWKGHLLGRRVQSAGWTNIPRLQAQFDVLVTQQAKAFTIVLTPAFALVVALMRIRRREPGGLHIVFALHYLALSLLVFVGVGFVLLGMRWAMPGRIDLNSGWIPAAIVVTLAAYLTVAFRRAYGSRPRTALLQALVLSSAWLVFLGLYRSLVFVTALYSV